MARLSGFSPIITTSSLVHREFLKTLGATHVLDRKLSPEATLAEIVRVTRGVPLAYAYDAISEKATQLLAYNALGDGGALVTTDPYGPSVLADHMRPGDGKRVARVRASLTAPENVEVGRELYKRLTEWLRTGVVVVSRPVSHTSERHC